MEIKDVGILCAGCDWRNPGSSVECRHCGAALVTSDVEPTEWVARQVAIRQTKGLPSADGERAVLQRWVSELDRSELGVSVPEPPPQPTVPVAAGAGVIRPSSSGGTDAAVPERSGELLAAILTLLRGFALFLILSFVGSFFVFLGAFVELDSGSSGTGFVFVGGLFGLGAIGALVYAWSESGNPFKRL